MEYAWEGGREGGGGGGYEGKGKLRVEVEGNEREGKERVKDNEENQKTS